MSFGLYSDAFWIHLILLHLEQPNGHPYKGNFDMENASKFDFNLKLGLQTEGNYPNQYSVHTLTSRLL